LERRPRREWEAEYVAEYVSAEFPGEKVVYHCRLGTWPTPLTEVALSEEEQAMLRVRMRWADAVILLPKKILVVEGKLRASEFLKGLGELQLYVHLVPHTEEFLAWKGTPVVGRLLIPIADPVVEAIARQQGIETAVYKPKFWKEFLTAIQPRQARAIRPEEVQFLGRE